MYYAQNTLDFTVGGKSNTIIYMCKVIQYWRSHAWISDLLIQNMIFHVCGLQIRWLYINKLQYIQQTPYLFKLQYIYNQPLSMLMEATLYYVCIAIVNGSHGITVYGKPGSGGPYQT